MRAVRSLSLVFFLVCSTACLAQQWQLGAAGGFGFYHDASVTNGSGSAQIGFATQVAAGVVVTDDVYRYIGGEFRYTYRNGSLRLKARGQEANMDGDAHAFTYELLLYPTSRGSRIRPFAAVGGGGKLYRGTGREAAFQPLSGFDFLTKTRQMEPVVSFGGGVKAEISRHALFRVDFRDYASPVPDKLFTPAPGARIHGWLHDLVPLVGVSYVF
jgi:hypothetical protein